MVDVAVVSVVATAGVALGSMVLAAYSGRAQRKHEAGLAFSDKVWDAKSDVLLATIRLGLVLEGALIARKMRDVASGIAELQEFQKRSAEVETYGSKATRERYRSLVELCAVRVDSFTFERLRWARQAMDRAIDAQEFETASRHADDTEELLDLIVDNIWVDPPLIRDAARNMVESARKDLRDPTA